MNIRNMKVLVTGADGFIGSHLVEALLERGCRVRAFVYYNSFNHRGWLDTLPAAKVEQLEIVAGDIRDAQSVRQAVRGCDGVFHLAALIGIPYSYLAPEAYVATNITGTLNVLLAAREFEVRKTLITSTSEVYGTAQYVPIDEQHPLQAQSPYSASKIGADKIAESFYRSFATPVTIVRPFNTFGPRQSARAIIPTIIVQLLDGHRQIRIGHTTPTRDFLFVKDTVAGFIAIAESDRTTGEQVNIATGIEISMGNVARKIIDAINPKAELVCEKARLRPAASEVERLLGANEKIRRLTGWTPRYSFDKGLRETLRWFSRKENLKRYNSGLYNV